MIKKLFLLSLVAFCSIAAFAQNHSLTFGILKYNGGGDWYANPTSMPNFIKYLNKEHNMRINPEPEYIEVGSADIFNYPFIHMTGHGNVVFNTMEAENLRNYLVSGGFLHIDDNYGMDPFIRPMMKRVFPELDFIELPLSHPIYKSPYNFSTGLPKIHEHDNKPPQGFGLIYEGRLVCFYTYETDLGNGWEDSVVHNNPEWLRQKALEMGANMIHYIFNSNRSF
ncbi:MAG: DUF4159 domain-containing protein [Luteibaculaceae bacterium]